MGHIIYTSFTPSPIVYRQKVSVNIVKHIIEVSASQHRSCLGSTESFLFKLVSAVTVLCLWCLFVFSVEMLCKLGEFLIFVSTLALRIF